MNRFFRCLTAPALLIAIAASAQEASELQRQLGEAVAWGRRPLKEIGLQTTRFDSLALKESVAQSMADVLTYGSSVFVKSYGRSSQSTVTFRGTSPSHTTVSWNGLSLSNPMLGMADFSTIPSFLVDRASLLYGTSSVAESGGGLGGLVQLSTLPSVEQGVGLQYVQGIGSYKTFDEYGRFTYGTDHWAVSTRAVYSSSDNDFSYTNRDKTVIEYDADHNIVNRYHPKERNRCGDFHDFHLLQEVYYNTLKGDRLGLSAWLFNSSRGLPMLSTDYSADLAYDNRQHERTLRAVASWDHVGRSWRLAAKGGYVNTRMAYDYSREVAQGVVATMSRSRTRLNTIYAQADAEYSPRRQWYFTASYTLRQHFMKSSDLTAAIGTSQPDAFVGYHKARVEMSASVSAKWRPTDRIGLSAVLREELSGRQHAPLIPALFAEAVVWRPINLTARASISRNYRFPSFNDRYFMPGGNPDLKLERGFTYDAGLSFDIARAGSWSVGGNASWFDSHIDDWIIWLPTTKGYFTPRNLKKVHAYGVEIGANAAVAPATNWFLDLNASYSWTPSINRSRPMTDADRSMGKQLPYVPRHSASLTARITWRSWHLTYKWVCYSRRFTMSSNDLTLSGYLPTYYMNNIVLEKQFAFRPLNLDVKLALNNIFNEQYLTVLSRPMPGTNFELFFTFTPKL